MNGYRRSSAAPDSRRSGIASEVSALADRAAAVSGRGRAWETGVERLREAAFWFGSSGAAWGDAQGMPAPDISALSVAEMRDRGSRAPSALQFAQ